MTVKKSLILTVITLSFMYGCYKLKNDTLRQKEINTTAKTDNNITTTLLPV